MLCVFCRKEIDDDSKYCSNCGKILFSIKCSNCDAEVKTGSRFCKNCGVPVAAVSYKRPEIEKSPNVMKEKAQPELKKTDKPKKEKTNPKGVLFGLICAFVLVIIAAAVVYANSTGLLATLLQTVK